MSPPFADIRSILAGVEAQRLGYDPIYQNPLDPFGRIKAYPCLSLLQRFSMSSEYVARRVVQVAKRPRRGPTRRPMRQCGQSRASGD